ncbi:receptor-type tyrosine-protein phosphatase T-like [Saccostrea cucullata]|uniref:receptor-type tyrosine-protein phosphatase T-like n=1 Tax=Saccostrea cuccullata TaxID=36930 RepID=UPI002ED40725
MKLGKEIIVVFNLIYFTMGRLAALQYKAVSQSSVPGKTGYSADASLAVDGDPYTFTLTGDGVNNYWKITFDSERTFSCFTIIIRSGQYSLSVNTDDELEQYCNNFTAKVNVSKNNITKCCFKQLKGDSLTITRTDQGRLRLYEFSFKDCKENQYGERCRKCNKSCRTCDQANGSCLTCVNSSWYGKSCDKKCPYNCSDGKCDITDGACSSCYPGYHGQTCEPCDIGRYGVNCNRFCSDKCRGPCVKETGDCFECKSELFKPPSCLRRIESTTKSLDCNKCDNCDNRQKWDKCKTEIQTNCSNCRSINCSSCSEKTCDLNVNKTCSACPHFCVLFNKTITMDTTSITTSPSPYGSQETNDQLLAVLFGMIILVLLLILLLIKRLKILRKSEITRVLDSQEPREEQPLNLAVPQNILGNEANTIFLEEITQADDIVLDEIQRLDVEYTNTIAHRIPVDKFIEYHSIRRENNIFEEEEFAKIPTGLMELYTEAVKKENICKNRYRYVYPYDFCRIVLSTSEEQGRNDYINACYVEGINGDPTYIAAQGPFTPATLVDFWRMTWQENSSRIVMLTNLFEGDHMKCLKYWPEDEDTFGDLVIRLESQDIYEKYTIRHLVVQQAKTEDINPNENTKKVTQFHFTGWPDCGVPSDVDSLLCFRDLVKNGRPEADGPIIVHCSAGIGRTGTFIALDYLLEEGATMESVDIINCVSKLRQQRAHSIQTKAQYIFLYDALAQGLKNIRRKSLYQLVDEI